MAIWYGFHRKTLWVIFEDSRKQCISPFSLEDCLQLFGLCFESSVHLPCYSDVSSEHPLTITLERGLCLQLSHSNCMEVLTLKYSILALYRHISYITTCSFLNIVFFILKPICIFKGLIITFLCCVYFCPLNL